MQAPANVPEKGFYYHYKHDPSGLINNYAYEVVGVGFHTEKNCRTEDMNMVIYRPLYESAVYKIGKFYDLRPLGMFMESVMKDGKATARFQKIADPKIIATLQAIKERMYDDK